MRPTAASASIGPILVAPDASTSEKWAASQLSAALGQITGSPPPIVNSGKNPAIAVGRSELTDRLGIAPQEGEACLLRTAEKTLVIAGGRARGTMYGVFELLHRLGCRWYTEDVSKIPAVAGLRLGHFNETVRPAFSLREVFFTEAQGKEWSARNRLNGHFHNLDETTGGKVSYFPFAHSFQQLIPAADFFATHPEYFSLIAGVRRPEGAQLCLSNPDLPRVAADRVRAWIAEHPEASAISVSQNDGYGWCECGPCRALFDSEGGTWSGPLLRFVNDVAGRVRQTHAGATIDTLAYQGTADPPTIAKPAANVQIRFCPIDACQAHPYEACVFNARSRKRLEGWLRISPNIVLWHYAINFAHYLVPFPNEREIMADLPYFGKAGVKGIFLEGAVSEGGGADDAEFRSWLAAQLLWNPGADLRREIQGYFAAVYGAAATLVSRWFALRSLTPGDHLWVDQDLSAAYLTTRYVDEAKGLLARASKMSTGAARRRIDRHLLSLEYLDTMRNRRIVMRPDTVATTAAAITATRELERNAASLGITHLREGYPLAEESRALENLAATRDAIALANEQAEILVVPSLGGRILSWKKNGEEQLAGAQPGDLNYPNVGGISVSFSKDYVSRAELFEWETGTVESGRAILEAGTKSGLAPRLTAEVRRNSVWLSIRVTNSDANARSIVLRIECLLPLRGFAPCELDAGFERRRIQIGQAPGDERVGYWGERLPRGVWSVRADSGARIQNQFDASLVERCTAAWSFRDQSVFRWALVTPETILGPDMSLELNSEYERTEG